MKIFFEKRFDSNKRAYIEKSKKNDFIQFISPSQR